MSEPLPARESVDVYFDESTIHNPKLTLAGGVVFQTEQAVTEERIEALRSRLLKLRQMQGERAHKSLLKKGFHATADLPEASVPFVQLLGENSGAKVFIEYSDYSIESDITEAQRIALLEFHICKTVFQMYRWVDEIRFTFEENQGLNKHYAQIVGVAADRAGYRGDYTVIRGKKMEPHLLSIVDYALYLFGRAHQDDSEKWEERNWKAIRPLISRVKCLERKGVDMRRGLVDE